MSVFDCIVCGRVIGRASSCGFEAFPIAVIFYDFEPSDRYLGRAPSAIHIDFEQGKISDFDVATGDAAHPQDLIDCIYKCKRAGS